VSEFATGLREMSTSLRMRNIIVAVYMCGKCSAVLTVTTQSRDSLGICFVKSS